MTKTIAILLTLAVCVELREAARIFAWFPAPSISHQVVFRPLTQELARRGHEVTVVTTDPVFSKGQTPANLTEIDVHDISYDAWKDAFMAKQNEISDNIVKQIALVYDALLVVMEKQLNTVEMRNIVSGKEKFDLLLIEAVTIGALALKHVIKAPTIMISSFGAAPGNMDTFGAPVHPFLYPTNLHKRLYNLSTWEKLQELYLVVKFAKLDDLQYPKTEKALYKYFSKDMPPLRELAKSVDLLLLNDHPVWSGIRPVPPNVVYISGIHQKPRTTLPEGLEKYIDSSEHGVIYMSFGTNVDPSILPPEKIQAFIKAFSELPYDVLWKWNEDELPGRTKNIKISKWFPQSDLLHHPKVKLFITQGGLQSTDEAISAGMPVIGVPIMFDQWFNVEQYLHHRVGMQLDIHSLDAEIVKHAIETVIGDPSYRANMLRIRDLMRDEPMSPLERAVWWTEHVLRHGGARHLRAPAANMSWREYYEVDLVLLVLGVILASLFVGATTVCLVLRFLIKNVTSKIKKA